MVNFQISRLLHNQTKIFLGSQKNVIMDLPQMRLLITTSRGLRTSRLIYLSIGRVGSRITLPFLQWRLHTWPFQQPAALLCKSFPKVVLSFDIQDQLSPLKLTRNFNVLVDDTVPSVQLFLMDWIIGNWIMKTICKYETDTASNASLASWSYLPPLQSDYLISTQTAGILRTFLVPPSLPPQVPAKFALPKLIPTPKVAGCGFRYSQDFQGQGNGIHQTKLQDKVAVCIPNDHDQGRKKIYMIRTLSWVLSLIISIYMINSHP